MSDRTKEFVSGENLKVYNHTRKSADNADQLARRKARLQRVKKWSALGAQAVKTIASVALGGGPKLQININIGGKNKNGQTHQPNNNNMQQNAVMDAVKQKSAMR